MEKKRELTSVEPVIQKTATSDMLGNISSWYLLVTGIAGENNLETAVPKNDLSVTLILAKTIHRFFMI